MSSKKTPTDIARQLRDDLVADGRDSRRMRSLTFWRQFGITRRTSAGVERVVEALSAAGLTARTTEDVLGREGRLAWITVAIAEPALAARARHVDFGTGDELLPIAAAAEALPPSEPASLASPRAHAPGAVPTPIAAPGATEPNRNTWAAVVAFATLHPIAFLVVLGSLFGAAGGGRVGPFLVIAFLIWAARSDLFGEHGFATRHPAAIALILVGASALIVDRRLEVLVGIACVVWVARVGLQRTPALAANLPSVDTVLDWANGNRIGVAVTGIVALLTLSALGALIGGQEPATDRPARNSSAAATEAPTTPPTAAPGALRIVADVTSTADPAASPTAPPTATHEPEPPTAPPPTATDPPPPTATPIPVPPTARPPIDIDPNRDQNCDSFPEYLTMKAWRDYWQARGVRNPGRLDGDGDGLACEEGEGGRPAPPPPPRAPVPLYQAPAPAPASGGGGGGGNGGCCVHCKSGKPCGDSCIARNKTCHKGPGCACGGG